MIIFPRDIPQNFLYLFSNFILPIHRTHLSVCAFAVFSWAWRISQWYISRHEKSLGIPPKLACVKFTWIVSQWCSASPDHYTRLFQDRKSWTNCCCWPQILISFEFNISIRYFHGICYILFNSVWLFFPLGISVFIHKKQSKRKISTQYEKAHGLFSLIITLNTQCQECWIAVLLMILDIMMLRKWKCFN